MIRPTPSPRAGIRSTRRWPSPPDSAPDDDRELEGVIAHELGHVLHRDILISSVAATIAAAITMLARMAFWFGGRPRDDDRGGADRRASP